MWVHIMFVQEKKEGKQQFDACSVMAMAMAPASRLASSFIYANVS
jgi:hypothetical protein